MPPIKKLGQVPKALVVRKPGSNISEKDIYAFVDGKSVSLCVHTNDKNLWMTAQRYISCF